MAQEPQRKSAPKEREGGAGRWLWFLFSIVVGLPLHLDGREGASARRARKLAEALRERTGRPVILWDERLSSLAAERALREGGVKAKDQKGLVDRVAAALLLSSYLDSRQEP